VREKFSFSGINPKIVLIKKESETRTHIVLKLLAYLMFGGKLSVEKKVKSKYKPDLVFEDEKKGIWVECGAVSEKKLLHLKKHSDRFDFYFFKKDIEEGKNFSDVLKKFSFNAIVYAFEKNFVKKISENLYRNNSLKYKIDSEFKIEINGIKIKSKIYTNALNAI